jgi:hypothetical protein
MVVVSPDLKNIIEINPNLLPTLQLLICQSQKGSYLRRKNPGGRNFHTRYTGLYKQNRNLKKKVQGTVD